MAREPLEDGELETLLDAADEHADAHRGPSGKRDRLFIYALAFLGVRASTLAHMTKEWVDFQSRQVRVPASQQCRAGRGGGPCSECRKRLDLLRADPDVVATYADPSDTWDGQGNSLKARARRFRRYADRPGLGKQKLRRHLRERDGMWFPKSGAGRRPVPVKDDTTWTLIQEHFQFHDELMVTRQTVGNALRRIARQSNLTRKVEPHEMRHTYGTRLAAMGFSAYEIKDAMGHATTQQAEDYVKMAGERIGDAFEQRWESL